MVDILEEKHNLTYSELSALTLSLGWGKHYYPTEALFNQVLSASAEVAYSRDEGRLIAFGRIVTDGMHCMFYDICVHPAYQGQHLGSAIMRHLIDKIKDKNYVCIGLFAEDDNETVVDFYRKLGFSPSRAMELKAYMRDDWP